jgi:flagellar biosynthesis/type III secretory pathway M-ring protein FliF/YscJ
MLGWIMSKTAKVLLVLAIICLVAGVVINIGWVDPGKMDALYVLLPVGAVLLGLFLIVLVLEKERMADEDDRHVSEADEKKGESSSSSQSSSSSSFSSSSSKSGQ